MLITGETSQFEPFGLQVLDSCKETEIHWADSNELNKAEDEPFDRPKKVFRVRKGEGDNLYEEIYASGKKAIWSCNNALLLKTFCTDFPIIDAFWHTFTASSKDGVSCADGQWDALCIIGEKNIDIYRTNDGERFQETLPFPVRLVCSTQFGLLLEREPTVSETRSFKTGDDQHFPFLFSISHPLNEIVPVIYKPIDVTGQEVVRYTTNLKLKVVHSDLRLSLLLTFDEKTGHHNLWKITKACKQDAMAASEFLQQSLLSNLSTSTVFSHSSLNLNLLTPSLARSGAGMFSFSPSVGHSVGGPSSISDQPTGSLQQTTATTSLSSGLLSHLFAGAPSSTPEQQFFRPALYVDNRSPATIARGFPSPTLALTPRLQMSRTPGMHVNPAVTRIMRMNNSADLSPSSLVLTPRSIGTATPRTEPYQYYFPSPPLNSYHAGDYMRTSTYIQSTVPFVPDLCLEPFWSETSAQTRGDFQSLSKVQESATRAVVIENFAGGIYFCYLIPSLCQLRCVQIMRKDTNGQASAPGSVTLISCRHVAVLSDSQFMIVLDQNYCLSLYNGVRKISSLLCNTFALLSPPDKYTSEFNKSHASRILSSSEVVSACDTNNVTAAYDAMDVLSPVTSDQLDAVSYGSSLGAASGTVAAIDTFCESSPYFLVILRSRRTCRCSIPQMDMDPLVQLCLEALKSVLPSDITVDLYSSWCVNRQLLQPNTGSPDCPEIMTLMKLIMETTGFSLLKMFRKFGLADEPVELPAKRSKCSEDGTDSDWSYLVRNLASTAVFGQSLSNHEDPTDTGDQPELGVQAAASCFNHLPAIFYALHCCYEEMKLNQLHWPVLQPFGECLCAMAKALHLQSYVDHYLRDGAQPMREDQSLAVDTSADLRQLRFPAYWSPECFSIFRHIYQMLKGGSENGVSIIACCERLWLSCLLYRLLHGDVRRASDVHDYIATIGGYTDLQRSCLRVLDNARDRDATDLLANVLRIVGGATGALSTYPPGVIAPLLLRLTPMQLRTVRPLMSEKKTSSSAAMDSCQDNAATRLKSDDADGMAGTILNDELSRMLFPSDLRLSVVRHMLRSSKQTKITLKQKPGVADNEFREEQERYLYSVCVRTMALPFGRGMFTLRSHRPVLAESIDIPKLCLTGRTSGPQPLTIDLSHIDVPANMDLWAKFHNGVAAGLRLAPPDLLPASDGDSLQQHLDTSWIVYNMPRSTSSANPDLPGSLTPEHAGVLFGLGLNGHLSNLALFNLHEYLVKGDPMTSTALLLGITAAKRCTAELQSMKMLATHLPFLLSPTLLELNIDPMVQTAAVFGVGLLYAESGNYRLAEALLREIGRPATAANDNFADRESYALSCGFALGFITLGLGDMVFGDPNFTLADELRLLMNGGHKRQHHYATDSPSSQLVIDGDYLNVHVTSAPAIIALGLMYLKSNNRQVASWLDPPETAALLDTMRPDFLMLRTVSKCIILWDDILPRVDWIEGRVPPVVARFRTSDEERLLPTSTREHCVDLETVAQAYCNIVAGACLAVGLKFAGSANADALQCLLHYYKLFDGSLQQQSPVSWHKIYNKAGRYTTETAFNVIVMAMGAVMAGTGNLDVLRIVRHLRQRVGQNCTNWLLHGGHLAANMALGLLFLGGCRYTLSTTNLSVAVLLCALYPKFPISPNDNRFHLQAFRHLYVLACEPRLLVTVDHLSSELAYSNVNVKFKACQHYDAITESLTTPCMLPELALLEEVQVNDERYWPVQYSTSFKWEELRSLLNSQKGLEICRRSGFCTRKEDPLGHKSVALLYGAHTDHWVPPSPSKVYYEAAEITESLKLWCSTCDCEGVYSSLVDMFQLISGNNPRTFDIWQLKLLLAFAAYRTTSSLDDTKLANVEFLLALELNLRHKLCEGVTTNALKSYMESRASSSAGDWWPEGQTLLGQFVTFFDLPTRSFWVDAGLREYRSMRLFLEKFSSLDIPMKTALILYRILMKG